MTCQIPLKPSFIVFKTSTTAESLMFGAFSVLTWLLLMPNVISNIPFIIDMNSIYLVISHFSPLYRHRVIIDSAALLCSSGSWNSEPLETQQPLAGHLYFNYFNARHERAFTMKELKQSRHSWSRAKVFRAQNCQNPLCHALLLREWPTATWVLHGSSPLPSCLCMIQN